MLSVRKKLISIFCEDYLRKLSDCNKKFFKQLYACIFNCK